MNYMINKAINYTLFYWIVLKHKIWVLYYILKFVIILLYRGIIHDYSKFTPSETNYFIKTVRRFKKIEYGTQEYRNIVNEIKPGIELHQKRNSHHPEYYKNGVSGMSLYDLIEMFCDWNAASKQSPQGNIANSIEYNYKNKGLLSKQLYNIFKNTTK